LATAGVDAFAGFELHQKIKAILRVSISEVHITQQPGNQQQSCLREDAGTLTM